MTDRLCPGRRAVTLMVVLTAGACLLVPSLLGCDAARTQDARWSSTATETPQPDWFPPDSYVETMTAMREAVSGYVKAAVEGDREAMESAYLPETRRSAQNVVARDLEAAARTGWRAANMRSVLLHDDALWPPTAAADVRELEERRLRELVAVHEDANLVLVDQADGGRRAYFVVADGGVIALVP